MGEQGQQSIIEDHGTYKTTCGYCKNHPAKTSVAHGMWAYSMMVDQYQELLNRGWRRSGCFMYKPHMKKTCCPSYTIRLNAEAFQPDKEQQRVLRKLERYLAGELADPVSSVEQEAAHEPPSRQPAGYSSKVAGPSSTSASCSSSRQIIEDALGKSVVEAVTHLQSNGEISTRGLNREVKVKLLPDGLKRRLMKDKGETQRPLYTCSIAFQLAVAEKSGRSYSSSTASTRQGTESASSALAVRLAELWTEKIATTQDWKGWSVEGSRGHLNFYAPRDLAEDCSNSVPEEQGRGRKRGVQETLRGADPSWGGKARDVKAGPIDYLSRSQKRLEIRTARSSFDPEEFALYHKYQVRVHKDAPGEVTTASYKQFLVDTPLEFVPPGASSRPTPKCGFGSFHQQYRIDGRLVAVGVVDILPNCLSSKYLFWDPDLAFLSLGKLSALKEIEWVTNARKECPSLQYYYLGYYIHTCQKMRYKASYRPSELLCQEHLQWLPHSGVVSSLGRGYTELCQVAEGESAGTSGFTSTSRNPGATGNAKKAQLEEVALLVHGLLLQFKQLKRLNVLNKEQLEVLALRLKRWMDAVGPDLAQRLGYVLG